MPIYKTGKIKNGLQKYIVRINYFDDSGQAKQLTRVAYGSGVAKDLETALIDELKNKKEKSIKKMTALTLFNKYAEVKKYELRKSSFAIFQGIFKRYILPMFENYYIDKISVATIQDWKVYMEKKRLALSTKKKAFTYFNSMIKYAIKMEYLQKNPLSKIGNFKETLNVRTKMNVYTPQEFKKFITSAKEIATEKERTTKDLSEWNYYVFFNIAFYTGLRKGEIHALKWSDIEGICLSVNRSISQKLKGGDVETAPKNKSSIRTLQMPLPLIEVLGEQKKRQQLLHNFTDDFRICGNVRDTTLKKRKDRYSTTAGLKIIRIHDFRHTHASVLAYSKINIQEVARRLGHARVEITWNTYCHLYPGEEERAVTILNNLT